MGRILRDGRTCKPRSVSALRCGDHLSGSKPLGWTQAAYPGLKGSEPLPVPKDIAPAWPCSRWGMPGRRHCCRRRWSLKPPFHPCQPVEGPRGSQRNPRPAGGCFLWPYPRVAPSGCYPAPCSAERGLSSDSAEPPAITQSAHPRLIIIAPNGPVNHLLAPAPEPTTCGRSNQNLMLRG